MGLDESALTLSQRAYVNLNSLRNASRWLFVIVSAILLFNLLAIVAWQNIKTKSYEDSVHAMIITSFLLSVYIVLWYIVKGPHAYKRLHEWEEDYVNNAYVLIFDTTIPEGNSTGQKVLYLSKLVFPQLRPDLLSIKRNLLHPCNTYVNPDGSLTAGGKPAYDCISNGCKL